MDVSVDIIGIQGVKGYEGPDFAYSHCSGVGVDIDDKVEDTVVIGVGDFHVGDGSLDTAGFP